MIIRALLAIQSSALRRQLRKELEAAKVVVTIGKSNWNLWDRISRDNHDLIIISREQIPDPVLKTIGELRTLPDQPEIIVIDDGIDPEARTNLLAAGCLAVLDDEAPNQTLAEAVRTYVERGTESLQKEVGAAQSDQGSRLDDFVLKSNGMAVFVDNVRRVVGTESTILILGETGVGKERLANAIHNEGPRLGGPFVAVNCGAFPESLLESELFGHEEGAFTGASRARRGYFELAHGGTIFLDEIAEVPTHLQVKLLRVLQKLEIRRLGSEQAIPVNVRVIAATNRDLRQEVAEKRFREDLFYRLSVVTLEIPPLRLRQSDIQPLAESFVETCAARIGRPISGIHEDALECLETYDWPGNVQELSNVMERAVLLTVENEITPPDLPPEISLVSDVANQLSKKTGRILPLPPDFAKRPWAEVREEAVEGLERMYLDKLLKDTGGKVGKTAEKAGIQPRSLFTKMKKLGLRKEDYKSG